jgi:hypothetical protein
MRYFYDLVWENSEYFIRGPNPKNKLIVRCTFSNSINKIIHTRKVMDYMDWLGIIGGLRSVLTTIFIGVLFKGYSNFNSTIETFKSTNFFLST